MRFIDPDGMKPMATVQGTPHHSDSEDPTQNEVATGQVGPDQNCERCASLPEVVVEAPKIDKAIALPLTLSPSLGLNPIVSWAGISFGAAYVAYEAGIHIEATTISIANVLEKFGVDPKVLGKADVEYVAPPKLLPGFPGANRIKPKGGRARWKTSDGEILEWDSQHGDVEVYDKNGKHKGSARPNDPSIYKSPVPGRKIDP